MCVNSSTMMVKDLKGSFSNNCKKATDVLMEASGPRGEHA